MERGTRKKLALKRRNRMTHRAKSFIVCLIGLAITFLGWTYESRLAWDIGIITFVIAFLASLVKHDSVVKINNSVDELLAECKELITARNSWDRELFYLFDFSFNINFHGEIDSIGKFSEWRATLEWGTYEEHDQSQMECINFFGKTPEEALTKLLAELQKPLKTED